MALRGCGQIRNARSKMIFERVGIMANGDSTSDKPSPETGTNAPRVILSLDLMGDDKVVIIRHGQEDYRLRITAMGKLILTK